MQTDTLSAVGAELDRKDTKKGGILSGVALVVVSVMVTGSTPSPCLR